ncbi:MAG: bacteriophage holin [Waddliaceae bacterium]
MLHPVKLGLAGGILWSVSMLALSLLSFFFGYAPIFMELLKECYPGFDITVPGTVIGMLYGFFDAFIGLFILAWLYNRLCCHYGTFPKEEKKTEVM